MKNENITGIILAGGKSSRMGSDKGMIVLNGKKFIEYILSALIPNVNEVIIIANNKNYDYLGYKVYEDLIKDCGPLAGIYTGLMNSKTEKNIVVGCDIPFITSDLIKYIIEHSNEADIAVPVYKDKIEPLCAFYSKKITTQIHSLIIDNKLKIRDILPYFVTKEINMTPSGLLNTDNLFVNINTEQELNAQKNLQR